MKLFDLKAGTLIFFLGCFFSSNVCNGAQPPTQDMKAYTSRVLATTAQLQTPDITPETRTKLLLELKRDSEEWLKKYPKVSNRSEVEGILKGINELLKAEGASLLPSDKLGNSGHSRKTSDTAEPGIDGFRELKFGMQESSATEAAKKMNCILKRDFPADSLGCEITDSDFGKVTVAARFNEDTKLLESIWLYVGEKNSVLVSKFSKILATRYKLKMRASRLHQQLAAEGYLNSYGDDFGNGQVQLRTLPLKTAPARLAIIFRSSGEQKREEALEKAMEEQSKFDRRLSN